MKKVILCLLMLLLTGCSVEYDLLITDKQIVKEKIVINKSNKDILGQFDTVDEYINYYEKYYPSMPTFENYRIKGKSYEEYTNLIVTSEYEGFKNYIKSHSYRSMFSDAVIENVGDYTTFRTTPNLYLKTLDDDTFLDEEFSYKSFVINIQFYNEVINHNADKVDEKNNIYTWVVTADDAKEYITFKMSDKVRYDVVIKDFLKKNMLAIIIVGGVIIVSTIGGIVIYKKYKKDSEF